MALLLLGCGTDTLPQASAPDVSVQPGEPVAGFVEPVQDPKLNPLFGPDEVLGSLPRGRQDPFSPPPRALAEASADQEGRANSGDVRLMGVSAANGMVRAFVSFNGQTGPVATGDVGGPGTPWLPDGLAVAAIDVQRGQLVLARDGRPLPVIQL